MRERERGSEIKIERKERGNRREKERERAKESGRTGNRERERARENRRESESERGTVTQGRAVCVFVSLWVSEWECYGPDSRAC